MNVAPHDNNMEDDDEEQEIIDIMTENHFALRNQRQAALRKSSRKSVVFSHNSPNR